MGRLYCITSSANGKMYVGITERPVAVRWREHVYRATWRADTRFHRAIVKYGAINFEVCELHIYPTIEEAAEAEKELILQLGLQDRRCGYNATPGGDLSPMLDPASRAKAAAALRGRRHSPEAIARMSAVKLGKKMNFSAKARENMLAAAQARRGISPSPETRAKISKTLKGRARTPESVAKQVASITGKKKKPMSDIGRANIAAAHRGIIPSDVTRQRRAASMRAVWARRRAEVDIRLHSDVE